MSYCPECGAEVDSDSRFCQRCGTKLTQTRRIMNLASWGERFISYIIDIIILGIFFVFIRLPRLHLFSDVPSWVPLLDLGVKNIFYFLYFTFMEYNYGQSIGKMVMKLRVQHFSGRPIDIDEAAVESFGKAFLLPIDLIIGWILYPNANQRLFNYLSKTVVVEERYKR